MPLLCSSILPLLNKAPDPQPGFEVLLETLCVLAQPASEDPSLIPSRLQTLSTLNPFCAPPTPTRCPSNISLGFFSLGLCRWWCSLCLETPGSVPSHPDQFSRLQDSARVSPPGEKPQKVSGLPISSLCNSILDLEGHPVLSIALGLVRPSAAILIPSLSHPGHLSQAPSFLPPEISLSLPLPSIPTALLDPHPSLQSLSSSLFPTPPRGIFLQPKLTPPLRCS